MRSRASGSRTVPVTRAPAMTPSWTAAMPTPPAAPCTRSRSPTVSPACVNSASWAVVKTSGTPPAASQSSSSGTGMASRGRIVTIGVGAGAKAEIHLGLLMAKRGAIMGSTLRSRSLEEKALMTRAVEAAVLPGFASGDLSVFVAATYPLDNVAAAYERFRNGRKLGKIVLLMD